MNFPNSTTLRAYEAPMDSLRVTCSTTRYRTKGFISIQIATQFKKKSSIYLTIHNVPLKYRIISIV